MFGILTSLAGAGLIIKGMSNKESYLRLYNEMSVTTEKFKPGKCIYEYDLKPGEALELVTFQHNSEEKELELKLVKVIGAPINPEDGFAYHFSKEKYFTEKRYLDSQEVKDDLINNYDTKIPVPRVIFEKYTKIIRDEKIFMYGTFINENKFSATHFSDSKKELLDIIVQPYDDSLCVLGCGLEALSLFLIINLL